MKKPIVLSTVFIIIIVVVYVTCFYDAPLSDKTSDWGAFGSYVGIGISAISVALIYVTYNEQRQSNRIIRFEQQMRFMFDRLSVLLERNKNGIEEDAKKIEQHFLIPFYYIHHYERLHVFGVCSYYYSRISNNQRKYDNMFIYLTHIVKYIKDEKFINEDSIRCRMIELFCILPEYTRIYYFFWLIYQKESIELLRFCYLNNLFIKEESDNFLSAVICYVCTGETMSIMDIDLRHTNFELDELCDEYNSNEDFDVTYNRLNRLFNIHKE